MATQTSIGPTSGQAFGPNISTGDATGESINEFGLPQVLVDGFPIDAALSEDHTYDNDVTEYPVEKGADITDHVRPKPLKVTMEGIVSATPLGQIANHPTRQSGALPVDNALAKLIQLRDTAEPVSITTSLSTYKSMVLSSLSFPRGPGEPYQLHFKANFVQIIIVTNGRTTIRVAKPGGSGKTALGQRLAQLGIPFASVFTLKQVTSNARIAGILERAANDSFSFTPSNPPILVDSAGKHYVIYEGSPPSDGFVISTNTAGIKPGYHPWFGTNYDPSTGFYTDKSGRPVNANPVPPGSSAERRQARALDKAYGVSVFQPSELII